MAAKWEEIFVKSVLYEKVKLPASELHSGYLQKLLDILKGKLEAVCTRHGLIKKHSIEILQVYTGQVEVQTFRGATNFHIKFRADVCNPAVGSILACKVQNINSFGILCTCSFMDPIDNVECTVIDVIIPKQSIAIKSEIDLARVSIGQELHIEVMGKKFQLHDKKISVIGKVINSGKKKVLTKLDAEEHQYDVDEEEEIFIDGEEDDKDDDEKEEGKDEMEEEEEEEEDGSDEEVEKDVVKVVKDEEDPEEEADEQDEQDGGEFSDASVFEFSDTD